MLGYRFKGGCTYYWEEMKRYIGYYQNTNHEMPKREKALAIAKEHYEDYKTAGGKKPFPLETK